MPKGKPAKPSTISGRLLEYLRPAPPPPPSPQYWDSPMQQMARVAGLPEWRDPALSGVWLRPDPQDWPEWIPQHMATHPLMNSMAGRRIWGYYGREYPEDAQGRTNYDAEGVPIIYYSTWLNRNPRTYRETLLHEMMHATRPKATHRSVEAEAVRIAGGKR